MRMRGVSQVVSYSLSEFAFILLLVSLGTLAALYTDYSRRGAEIDRLSLENVKLKEEVNFLNEILAEKENAIVPCWRRPDGLIPPLVGKIVIHSQGELTIVRLRDDLTEELRAGPDEIGVLTGERLKSLFRAEREYAREKRCYIRIGMENQTNDFAVYHDLLGVLGGLGMVLVNE